MSEIEATKPCKWGGGNDYMACATCGLEYDYRKENRPDCRLAAAPQPPASAPVGGDDFWLEDDRTFTLYQVIGNLADAAGVFEDPAVIRALDLAAYGATQDGEDVLPFTPAYPVPEPEVGDQGLTAWLANLPKEPTPALRAAFEHYRTAFSGPSPDYLRGIEDAARVAEYWKGPKTLRPNTVADRIATAIRSLAKKGGQS